MLKYSVVFVCLFILGIYAMEQEKVCDICTDPDPVMKIKFRCQHEICINCFTKIHELNYKENFENLIKYEGNLEKAKCPFCRTALSECYHFYSLIFLRNPRKEENISMENLQQIFPLICEVGDINDVKHWVETLNVKFEPIKIIKKIGFDIWIPDYGHSILNSRSKEIAEYLLKKWSVNLKWNEKLKAVQQAAKIGNVNMLQYWIQKTNSAATDVPNTSGNTALFFAAKYGRLDCVRFLVDKYHANINSRNKNGSTPMIISCEQSNLEIVKFLKERGGNIYNVKKNNANTLFLSAYLFNFSISEYLLEEGMNPDFKWNCGATPFFIACQAGRLDFVKLLAKHGANMTLARDDGMTPLFAAVYFRKNYEIAKFILQNTKTRDTDDTMLFAVKTGEQGVIQILKDLTMEISMERSEQPTIDNMEEMEQFWDALDYIDSNNAEFQVEHGESHCTEPLANEKMESFDTKEETIKLSQNVSIEPAVPNKYFSIMKNCYKFIQFAYFLLIILSIRFMSIQYVSD